MNHTYRLAWNEQSQSYVAAPESARGRSKGGRASRGGRRLKPLALVVGSLLAGTALAAPPAANALPTGGQVVAGQAALAQNGNQLTITQGSDKAILNWQRFDIGSQAAVRFIQPSTTSVALNRVLSGEASQIQGQLSANGQVYLVNPNGVIFGAGAKVDVGGLVASTLDITNEDFLAGKLRFTRNGATGAILNQGELKAGDGGLVALLAPTVKNEGIVSARLGSVALAAGDKVTLEGGANGFLQVAVAPATVKTLIENKQMIVADGGQVVMTSKAADALSAGVVANSGSVQARTLQEKEGKILLLADMSHGEVQHSGVLDASAPTSGNGGFVETSAAKVSLPGNRKVTTLAARGKSGTWLIDPNDFLIGSGPYGGPPGNISGDTLSNDLTQGNVTISTATQGSAGGNGDIFVNDRVHWGANKLTLSAERNIYVNGVLDGSGSASLSLEYSQGQPSGGNGNYFIPGMINLPAGQNFSTRNGSSGTLLTYQVITSLGSAGSSNGTDLQGMRGNLSGRYVLGADIDASATRNWNSGAGFTPIGNFSTVPFQGSLDGLGHSISNLTINRPDTDMVGLFGGTTDATRLSNLWLENVDIKGYSQVGAIAGYFGGPSVYGIHVSGKVSGISEIGGLVGRLGASNSAEVTESHANVTVTASGNNAGGIVGDLMASSYASVNLYNLYSTGAVSANQNAGGIIGRYAAGNSGNTILSSVHASGPVTALANANGVLGQISSSGNAYMPVLVLYAAYWDSTSTGQSQGAPTSTLIAGSGASAVSSALGNLSAYSSSAYAGLGAWTCSGRRCVTGSGNNSWILFEGETRPFLSSEVGVAVSNAHQLQLISPIHSHYLTRDIDLSEINQAVAGTAPGSMWRSTGFVPLGDMANPFKGGIHGQGHVIRDLTIHRPTEDNVGLIGYSGSTFIEQLGLQNADIRGNNNVGALLGNIPSNSYSEIQESYSTGSVSGNGISVGGLIGSAYGNDWNMGLRRSFSSASVQGHNAVGGLIGSLGTNDYSIVVLLRDSYASGSVHSTGDDFSTKNGTGGLIGHVNAGDYGNTIIVSNSYASGAVSAEIGYLAGGLVGQMSGLSTPSVQDSLWNVTTTGRSNSAVGTGLSNTQMRQAAAFANWDIATQGGSNAIWRIYEGDSQPLLRAFLTPATLNGVANVSKVYDGQAFAGGTADAPNTQADKLLFGGTAQGAINAGTYSLRAYSEQLGYDLNGNRDATVSVAPKAITVIADAVSKVYGNADPALTWSTSGLVAGDVLSGSLNRAGGSNAGTYAINQGSLANSNYAITFQGANFSITPRPLSIIADAVSRLYGDADPAFTWQFAPGNSLLGGDTLSGSLGRQAGNNVGVYAITPGTLGNPNYSLAVQSGTLSITPRALTVTAQADSKVYGNADPLLAWSAPNLVNGDTLSGALSRSAGENVGSYAIGRGSLDNTNYTITFVGDTFAITPRPIVLQAGNQSRSYGQANPTTGFLTLSSGSLANGDTLGTASLGSSAATNAQAGQSYVLSPSNVSFSTGLSSNYAITYQDGTLTVTKAPLLVTASNAAKTYDGLAWNGLPGVSYSGFVLNEDASVLGGAVSYGGSAFGAINAGSYAIAPSGLSSSNYAITYVNGALNVAKAPLTVTASNAAKVYDALAWSGGNGVSYSGFVNGESQAVLGGSLGYGGNAQGAVNAGNYTLTPSGLTSGNYAISYSNGALTVSPRAITVKAADQSRVYGDANPTAGALALTAGSLVGSDALGNASVSSAATANANAGQSFALSPSNAAFSNGLAGNYAITYQDGSLAITPRPIVLQAGNQSRSYGQANPTTGLLTLSGGSLVNGDTLGTGSLSSSAPANAQAGQSYQLVGSNVAFSSGQASNYAITYQDGTLTVTKAPLTVTAGNAGKTYDGQAWNGLPGVSYSGFVLGENASVLGGAVTYGGSAFGAINAGSYAIAPSGLTSSNYAITYVDGALNVAKAPLTVTAGNAAKTYDGQAWNGLPGVSYSGFVLGENASVLGGAVTYGGSAFGAINAGSYAIAPSGLTSSNYAITYVDGALNVAKAPLTVTAANASKVYDGQVWSGPGGLSALQFAGFVNGENSSVLSGQPSYSGNAQGAVDVGTYAFAPAGLSSQNYAMTYHGGQLSITPRSLVVKAADRSRSYGAANPLAGQVVVAGGSLAQGDSLGEAHLSSAAEVTAGAGRQFALTPSSVAFAQGKADNYAITYQDGTLSITKAPLTVTALDGRGWVGSRPWQGGMGVSFAGFLNGDDASDLSGSLSYGGSSQGARKAGSYLLTPGGFASDNYDIAYVDGSLTLRNPPAVATASNTAVPGGGQLHRVTREEDKDSRLPQLPVVPAIPQFAQAPMSFIPYLAVGRDFIALPR